MKTSYLVTLDEEADPQLHSFLASQGATPESRFGEWRVPTGSRGSVKEELHRTGVEFRLRYEFSAESTDHVDELAAYVGIDILTTSRITSSHPILAKAPEGDSLIANTTMVDLLEPVTSDLEWQRHDGTIDDLWSLTLASELPDPIHTPHAFATVQGGNGLWMVLDDGRSIITDSGLSHLRVYGIAWTTRKLVQGRVLAHPAIPVFGGRVLDIIDKQHVELAFAPLYLPHEQSSVAPW
ncbi:hypothetical protein ACFYXH_12060 [Streptomyces sp. NPDC002730]|uniref:hypothetical protein n=1 Tax=Streptomyces sp. NPDC002730 TaxID=3364662 RepID=UPI0036CFBBC6